MFDFSFMEFIIVAIVAVLVLGPQELVRVVKDIRQIYMRMKRWIEDYWHALEAEYEEPIKYIKDMDGNLQPTYDIEEVLSKIEAANKEHVVTQCMDEEKHDQNAA